MSLSILEKRFLAVNKLGENTVQTVLQGRLELPGDTPPVERVISIKAVPLVETTSLEEDRVRVKGTVQINALYLPETLEEEQLIKRVEWMNALPFELTVEIPGVREGQLAEVESKILVCEWDLAPGQYFLELELILQTKAKVSEQAEYLVINDLHLEKGGQMHLDGLVVKPCQPALKIPMKKELSTILDLPEDGETLASILRIEPKLTTTIFKTEEDGLSVEGEVSLVILCQQKDYQVEELFFPKAFTFTFNLADYELEEEKLTLGLIPDCSGFLVNEGRSIRTELKLTGFVNYQPSKSVQVLTDLTAPGKDIAVRNERIILDNFINKKGQKLVARGLLELGEELPAIRQIFSSASSQAQILHYEVEEDLLIVEGVLDLDLFYLAHSEEDIKPLYGGHFPQAINFRQSLPVSGLEPGMQVELGVNTGELKFDLINRETVEVTATLELCVTVLEYLELEVVVEAVEVLEEVGEKPSLTYLFAQANDTIWKLAQQYGVTEEEILGANPGLAGKIAPGDKIQIPRK